ncbi:hypothetical protein GCM10009828_098950 [Actinoplanes couchii]|uniref:Serine/threonine protein kinase n=1 Tax=Actinoplanes couchii TaxID=403638 RepID=A0ABQ3XPN8_9ACTN|nr:hypothetical protein Aco03nite_088440 [Actinoplanes couchii]
MATVAGVLVAVYFGFRPAPPAAVFTPAPTDHLPCWQGDGNPAGIVCGDHNNLEINRESPAGTTRVLPRITVPVDRDETDTTTRWQAWSPRGGLAATTRAAGDETTTAVRVVTTAVLPPEKQRPDPARAPAGRPVETGGVTGFVKPAFFLAIERGGRLVRAASKDAADLRLKWWWLTPLNGAGVAAPDPVLSCARAQFRPEQVSVTPRAVDDLCVRSRRGEVHRLRVVPRPDLARTYPFTVRLVAG